MLIYFPGLGQWLARSPFLGKVSALTLWQRHIKTVIKLVVKQILIEIDVIFRVCKVANADNGGRVGLFSKLFMIYMW